MAARASADRGYRYLSCAVLLTPVAWCCTGGPATPGPGVQSRLHRLRRRLRHESTEEGKQVVKSRAKKIAATFMPGFTLISQIKFPIE